jgi:V/A-type H+-transporting ATPase subunit A
VTLHTKRFVRCFWELDKQLASARVFPAINTEESYSDYAPDVEGWWRERGHGDWRANALEAHQLLQASRRLEQLSQLVGEGALPDGERLVLAATRLLREAFLQQDAFDPIDRFSAPEKTAGMLRVLLHYVRRLRETVVEHRIPIERALALPVRRELLQMRFEVAGDGAEALAAVRRAIDDAFAALLREEGEAAPVAAEARP